MGDYHDHYQLIIKIVLLADVFENFIDMCLKYWGQDTFHYFISPGLRWDAILKTTEIELELISDVDIYLFIY